MDWFAHDNVIVTSAAPRRFLESSCCSEDTSEKHGLKLHAPCVHVRLNSEFSSMKGGSFESSFKWKFPLGGCLKSGGSCAPFEWAWMRMSRMGQSLQESPFCSVRTKLSVSNNNELALIHF